MVDNYHTSYIRKDLTVYNTHFSWWVKITIDKIDHNSRVGVMYYPSVENILACFPNAALLYHVNTVRLNQFNGSNRYKIHDNICIVGALDLILLSILVYLVQTSDLCWWAKVYIGIASTRPDMGSWPDTPKTTSCAMCTWKMSNFVLFAFINIIVKITWPLVHTVWSLIEVID
jgi:hypothetical protein